MKNTTAQVLTSPGPAEVKGIGFLTKITGQWHGPVSSTTSAGSFPMWYVDFRAVSPSQCAQYSLLDSNTVNITSFFIVKHNGSLKVAMRTEGCFAHKCCVTYEVIDSVNEAGNYFLFSDFVGGRKRAYTVFKFFDRNYVMEVYTSKFNKENRPVLHSRFEAVLGDRSAADSASLTLSYPKPLAVKDFSTVFQGMNESIFFNFATDPYPAAEQPYVGNVAVTIHKDPSIKTKRTDEICLLMTTQPLFKGVKYLSENMRFLSKYVYLTTETKEYTVQNVHPGTYYLYSFIDCNGDKLHKKGEYMNSEVTVFRLKEKGTVKVVTNIDMVIP